MIKKAVFARKRPFILGLIAAVLLIALLILIDYKNSAEPVVIDDKTPAKEIVIDPDKIIVEEGDEPEDPLASTEKIKAKSFQLGERQYQREINITNKTALTFKNHQVTVKLDTQTLVQQGKLSVDCSDIRFIDAQKKSELPFWMKSPCGAKNTKFWVRIPEFKPGSNTIYTLYGNKKAPNRSSFESVFSKEKSLVAWYELKEMGRTDYSKRDDNFGYGYDGEVRDLSGNGNDGVLSCGGYDYDCFEREEHPSFAHWAGGSSGFKIKSGPGLQFDKSQGAIEVWFDLIYPPTDPNHYRKILTDSNKQIELGIQPKTGNLYFYPAKAGGKNYNLVSNPFKKGERYHLVVSWDYATKQVVFYINGKKAINSVENVQTQWDRVVMTGDLTFADYAFAGLLDGIRIYDRALSEDEAGDFYKFHQLDVNYPEFSLGKEIVIAEEIFKTIPDYDEFRGTPTSELAQINLLYATAHELGSEEDYRYGSEGSLTDSKTGIRYFRISKREKEPHVIFGEPSHFYAYEGTRVKFSKPFLLTDIKFNINDRTLIKDLKISFSKIDDSKFNLIRPKSFASVACACGPLYGIKTIGESRLIFQEDMGYGEFWYRLENPIYVDEGAEHMQMTYLPSGKAGKLRLSLMGMLLMNHDGGKAEYVYPTFRLGSPDTSQFSGNLFVPGYYEAYFVGEEKGSVNFKVKDRILYLSFENKGGDSFVISGKSFDKIISDNLQRRVLSINVETGEKEKWRWPSRKPKSPPQKEEIVISIPMKAITKAVLGREIKPNGAVLLLMISLDELNQPKNEYYITFTVGEETKTAVDQNGDRIIRWMFGNDPYYFPRTVEYNTLYLYEIIKSAAGDSASFEKVYHTPYTKGDKAEMFRIDIPNFPGN